jgi:hypothetical protein
VRWVSHGTITTKVSLEKSPSVCTILKDNTTFVLMLDASKKELAEFAEVA